MSDVFLIAGQSNADGRAYHPAGYILPSFIHYEDRPLWPELSILHSESTASRFYGAEYNFARVVHAFTGETVNIVKVALSGVPLAQQDTLVSGMDWSSDSRGEMFDALTMTVNEVLDAMTARGDTPNIKGMLWMQGESDVYKDEWAAQYRANFEKFFEDLCIASPALADTRIGIGRIAEDYFSTISEKIFAMNAVRDAQADFVNYHENSFLIDTDSFLMNPASMLHYSEAGYNDLGLAFAVGIYGQDLANLAFNASGYLEMRANDKIALMGSACDDVRSFANNTKIMLGDGDDRAYLIGSQSKVWGESGNDIISLKNSSGYVDGGQGTDIVLVRSSMTLLADSLVDVERIHVAAGVRLNASASNVHDLRSYSTGTHGVSIIATSGLDLMVGGVGKDTLDGGGDVDTMSGGDGNDVYFVDNSGDIVVEANSVAGVGGLDFVYSFAGNYTLAANVENGVIKSSGAAALTGNDLNNFLYAGKGDNTIAGGLGFDTVSYAYGVTGAAGVTVSIADINPQATEGSGVDVLIGIENLVGSNNDDRLTGDSGGNFLNGSAGNDTLIGGMGKDCLTGGAGADVFKFNSVDEAGVTISSWDVINDFSIGSDKIDLSEIFGDVNATVGGQSALLVIGKHFPGRFQDSDGELFFDNVSHILYGNTDSDEFFEFAIQLTGVVGLENTDLLI